MIDQHKCVKQVYAVGSFRGHPCGRNATYEHDGKHYCKTHHPPTIQAQGKARKKAFETKLAAETAHRKQIAKEADEQHRRADTYPEMLEALQHCHQWLQGSEPGRAQYIGEVIARATGSAS